MAHRIFLQFAGISLVVACRLSCPMACGNLCSPTRDQTCISCIGRQTLNHGTTKEVLRPSILPSKYIPNFSCLSTSIATILA